jgi:hypothetical protein
MVLTAFAPIASPTSTRRCTTTKVRSSGVATTRPRRRARPRRASPFRLDLVDAGHDPSPRLQDAVARRVRIRHVDELHLRDHDRRVGVGAKAAAAAGEPRSVSLRR